MLKGVKKQLNRHPGQSGGGVISSHLKKVGLSKDAGAFLKQRQGTKLKDLKMANSIAAMGAEAEQRAADFVEEEEEDEDGEILTSIGREAENTRRRFFRELRKVLTAADVVIQVLDARDPGSCRSDAVEQEVSAAGKRLILLINKIDLVPKEAVEAWTKYLKRSGFPTIPFKAAHGGSQRPTHAMTSAANATEGLLNSSNAVVGADDLMQLLKNYSRSGGTKLKTRINVGIVGYPNTGKSSVINSMKRVGNAVVTGGRAGVTKVMQEVNLDSKITLIDSPGVVFEGDSDDPSVALRNVVAVEAIPDPVGVVQALLLKAPRESLMKFYNIQNDFANADEFLIYVAQMRGKLRRGAGYDLAAAAKSVISDWTTGKFRYYVMPPQGLQGPGDATGTTESSGSSAPAGTGFAQAETTEVVSTLAPKLDIDALFSGEGAQPAVLGAPQEQDSDEDMDCDAGGGMVEVDM